MPSLGDTLYHFTEWLRTTPLVDLSLWISNESLSKTIGAHFWVIPIFQVIHILAIAAAFGSVLMINMRILGVTGGTRTMAETVRRFLPWMWWSLPVLILSGFGMIIGEPVRELVNPVFWIKMVLVVGMVLVSIGYELTVLRPHVANWEATHDGRLTLRAGAVGIVLLWCAIMVAGRWIAYAPV